MLNTVNMALLKKHYRYPRLGVKIYSLLRLSIFPVEWFENLARGLRGNTLCLGCGYGVLEVLLALSNEKLSITASDLDRVRIQTAEEALRGVPNIKFRVLDVTKIEEKDTYDVIIFADLLHHLSDGEQEKLLDILWRMLKKDGVIIVKDVDTTPRWKYFWNYFHDYCMAGKPLTYLPSEFYVNYFNRKGVLPKKENFSKWWLPYNHYALIVKK